MRNPKLWTKLLNRTRGAVQGFYSSRDVPTTLYHFTSWPALERILTADALRFTGGGIRADDPYRFTRAQFEARDVICRLLKARASSYSELRVEFLRIVANMLRRSPVTPSHVPKPAVFVSSFWSTADQEDDWRHHGRQGEGVALGFKVEAVRGLSSRLAHVDKNPTRTRRFVVRLLDTIAEALEADDDEDVGYSLQLAYELAVIIIEQLNLFLGRSDGTPPREWRAIVTRAIGPGGVKGVEFEPELLSLASLPRDAEKSVMAFVAPKFGDVCPFSELQIGHACPVQPSDARVLLMERFGAEAPPCSRSTVRVNRR